MWNVLIFHINAKEDGENLQQIGPITSDVKEKPETAFTHPCRKDPAKISPSNLCGIIRMIPAVFWWWIGWFYIIYGIIYPTLNIIHV